MATRRCVLALLAMLFVAGAVATAFAAPRRHGVPHVTLSAEGPGTLIALRYGSGAASHVHFLHAHESLERVALADLDHDGHVDIVAAPRDGVLMFWHNVGHGRFARVALPPDAHRRSTRGPRIARVEKLDDGLQWGDDRHDAAMPRAPDVIHDVPIAAVRVTSPVYVRSVSLRRSSGRAPPVL